MQNAALSYNYMWQDPNGNPIKLPVQALQMAYTVAAQGAVSVADGTDAGTEIDIPFLGLAQSAVCAMIWNLTGQELNCAWGGNWAPHIPPGGMLAYAFPVAPTAGVITSLRFMLTQKQVGAGRIGYFFAGS